MTSAEAPKNECSGPLVSLARSAALIKTYTLTSVVAPPIGIAYLAGTLKDAGFDVEVIDAVGENPDQILPLGYCDGYGIGLTIDEVAARISASADIIGASCMFSNAWPNDARMIRKIRERFPNATIIVGGEHVTACVDYILETTPEVDICVLGEGEETMLKLVRTIRAEGDMSNVSGIAFRRNGSIHNTGRRSRITDIDGIPLPAWELLPLENYMVRGLGHGASMQRSMPLLATRGCPYQCTFCSSPQMWTTKWAARDACLVVDEMERYIELYNAENFDLYDLTMIIRKDWIIAFANELIHRGLKIEYQLPSGTRSEAIDEEVVGLLYRSGCRNMNYAPESGSPETLRAIKKKVKLPHLLKSLRAAVRGGLNVMCNIILFPDDTRRDVLKTFKFMIQCAWHGAHDMNFVPYVPYPGAELYQTMVAGGRVPPPSEQYFISLLTHSVFSEVKSYNSNFSGRQLFFLRLAFLGSFYTLSHLFHPYRIFSTAAHLVLEKPRSVGERTVFMLAERAVNIRASRSKSLAKSPA